MEMNNRAEDWQRIQMFKEAAKRVMLVVRKHRRKKGDPPEMPPIPSALLTVEDIEHLDINEEYTFYVFRTDTNSVLAKGIQGFEAAKARANQLRKSHGLRWDQVRFKAEKHRSAQHPYGPTGNPGLPVPKPKVDASPRYNPSKRGRFRGVWMPDGSYHDLD